MQITFVKIVFPEITMNGVFIHVLLRLLRRLEVSDCQIYFFFIFKWFFERLRFRMNKILRLFNCDINISSYCSSYCRYCLFQLNCCHLQYEINQCLLIFYMINISSNWTSVIRWNIFSTASESMFKHRKVNKSNYILFWVSGKILAMLW